MNVFFPAFDIKVCIFTSDVNLGSSVGVRGWRQMLPVEKKKEDAGLEGEEASGADESTLFGFFCFNLQPL